MNHGGGDIMMSVFVGVGRALRWDLLTSDLCVFTRRDLAQAFNDVSGLCSPSLTAGEKGCKAFRIK